MLGWLSRLSVNRRLALLAFTLGGVALFARVHPGHTLTLHEKDFLTTIERQDDHVTPDELAGWIIAGRSDYRLLDLRDAKAFAEYHVPTAENAPLGALTDAAPLRNEKLVLYSDGGVHAAQGWMLLRAKGYRNAYTLRGGLEAWTDEVLFPSLPAEANAHEQARFERAVAVAKFFGGTPRTGEAGEPTALKAPAMPKVEAPALPAGGAPAAPRKKKEGC